jgi:cell wall-associated NlpC family hydrolase/nucleoid-associated protein YgaU
VRRTHSLFSTPDLTALDRFARYKPRYLLHGVAAAVSVAALSSSLALHPRPLPVESAGAAQAAEAGAVIAVDVPPAEPTAAPAAPQPIDDMLQATIAPAEPPKPTTHTVEEGETLRMLAARFGLNPETIMAANGLRNPDLLQVGQDLVILPTDGVLYTLRSGETIRMVADHFNVDAGDIIRANVLGPNPDLVQPGTKLVVPGATPVLPSRRAAVGGTVQSDNGDQAAAAIGDGVSLPLDETASAIPSTRTYEVQSGDTLAGIADTFGVDVDTILSSNGIDDPDTIRPGSELRILPVKGVEYEVQADETLADIAYKYQVDLGLLLDYNDLNDPDVIRVGAKLVVPGGKIRPEFVAAPAPVVQVPAHTQPAAAAGAVVQVPAPKPAPAAPAPKPAPAPAPAAPALASGGGGQTVVANAMKFVGYRYVFGGTSPAGFDCSGFVFYIHNHSGSPVGRGMWQQYNGGAHVSMSALQPGDTVFFANTYMPGLSHDGIYIGGGQFVHASDERTGVTVSSLYTSYWQSHYVGATRLWD